MRGAGTACQPLYGVGEAGELVEVVADRGELVDQLVVGPGGELIADGGLPDEAIGRQAQGRGQPLDAGELVRVEAYPPPDGSSVLGSACGRSGELAVGRARYEAPRPARSWLAGLPRRRASRQTEAHSSSLQRTDRITVRGRSRCFMGTPVQARARNRWCRRGWGSAEFRARNWAGSSRSEHPKGCETAWGNQNGAGKHPSGHPDVTRSGA